ncbi:MAG: hypothetical protein J7K68_06400 [Candidatus Diapherotrites archaeon]|nr:hypothetical protein [Candidatus Diapherotrites archaeon]
MQKEEKFPIREVFEMEDYKKEFAKLLADTGALFFDEGLILKDGRPTPYFVNMGKFKTGKLNFLLGTYYADMLVSKGIADNIDVIFGPSYKGSAIANATVAALWVKHSIDKAFEYDRKEAKTHGDASKSAKLFVNGAFFDGCKVFLVDDVGTSMKTKYEAIEKLNAESERKGIKINLVGVGIGVDREQTTAVYDENGNVILNARGEDAIGDFMKKTGIPVYSVVGIREVIDYLYAEKYPVLVNKKKQPIPEEIKKEFDEYMKIYGVER